MMPRHTPSHGAAAGSAPRRTARTPVPQKPRFDPSNRPESQPEKERSEKYASAKKLKDHMSMVVQLGVATSRAADLIKQRDAKTTAISRLNAKIRSLEDQVSVHIYCHLLLVIVFSFVVCNDRAGESTEDTGRREADGDYGRASRVHALAVLCGAV